MYNDQALLTGGRVVAATGAGFVASQDHRHTFGLRSYGRVGGNVDYDWQGAYQTGSYAGLRVDAFAFNTDTGYTFHDVPLKPRLGVHVDCASGGADRTGGTLHTYQPMYPNTQYYVPNNQFAPTNFYDIAPRIGFAPTDTVRARILFLVPVALFRARRDLYRRAVARRAGTKRLCGDGAGAGPRDRQAVRPAADLDDYAAPVDPVEFGVFCPARRCRRPGRRPRPSSTPT